MRVCLPGIYASNMFGLGVGLLYWMDGYDSGFENQFYRFPRYKDDMCQVPGCDMNTYVHKYMTEKSARHKSIRSIGDGVV